MAALTGKRKRGGDSTTPPALPSVPDDTPDYLGDDDLEALSLAPETIRTLLRTSSITGHDGRSVVAADELADRLGLLDREDPL
jgi:hypothetical protein